jgi:hypothetical protein
VLAERPLCGYQASHPLERERGMTGTKKAKIGAREEDKKRPAVSKGQQEKVLKELDGDPLALLVAPQVGLLVEHDLVLVLEHQIALRSQRGQRNRVDKRQR